MRKQNLIDTIPAARGEVAINFYQGKRIVVSDNVEVNTSGAFPVFTSYLMSPNSIAFGSNMAGVIGLEQYRDPRAGLGAGQDWIISRTQWSMHPPGFDWLDASITGSRSVGNNDPIYPNWADYSNAANWDRKASSHKHIPWVAIRSNG